MKQTHLKLLLTALFWGGTFIAGRQLAGHVAPFSAAFLRFGIASFFLFLITGRIEGGIPALQKKQVLPILLLGMTGVFSYNFFFFKGLSLIQAGRASLIIANNPILIAVFSFFLFREPLNRIKVLGIVISVGGAMIAISRGNPAELFSEGMGLGDLYIVICVLSWVAYTLIGKHVVQELSPLTAVSYAALSGAAMLLIPALLEGMLSDMKHYSAADWLSLFYLGVFGTVLGFVWYYQGISRIGASRAGLYINFVPISAIVLAFLILHEPVTVSLCVGAIMVSGGVYLTNTGGAGARLLAEKR